MGIILYMYIDTKALSFHTGVHTCMRYIMMIDTQSIVMTSSFKYNN